MSSRQDSQEEVCVVIPGLTSKKSDIKHQNSEERTANQFFIFYCYELMSGAHTEVGPACEVAAFLFIAFLYFSVLLFFLFNFCAVGALFLLQFIRPHKVAHKLLAIETCRSRKEIEYWMGDVASCFFKNAFLPVLRRTQVEAVALGTCIFAV